MSEELNWVKVDDSYDLALEEGKLKARNKKGKILSSVPKKAKETEKGQELISLLDWLKNHEMECFETIDSWMLKSLPIPLEVLQSIWPDSTWRKFLENLVVTSCDEQGQIIDDSIGFLKDIHSDQGVGIVNLDGESEWINSALIRIPHPILIEDIDDFRELATELEIQQGCQQLMREIFTLPEEDKSKKEVNKYSGGRFDALRHAISRARNKGYRVSGGFAVCSLYENNVQYNAQYWIGADDPEYETETGDLSWTNNKQQVVELGELGPVTYSEGMRLAANIFAGRKIEKEEE